MKTIIADAVDDMIQPGIITLRSVSVGRLLCFISVLLSAQLVFAQDYYVSIDGNDINVGTVVDQPWRTVSKAVANVSAGDTVIVIGNSETSPTVYDERLDLQDANSGQPESWITFRAEPPHSVVLLQVRTESCQYVRIEGFKITSDSTLALEKSGIRISSNNIELINNHIYDFRHYPAIHATTSCDNIMIKDNFIERCNMGLWTTGNNWLVEDNEIRRLIRSEIGNDADYVRVFGSNHIYRGNVFHGTLNSEIGVSHTDGFQTFHLEGGNQSARDILIEGNVIMGAHQGIMIRDTEAEARNDNGIAPVYSLYITNWTIRNNVFAHLWSMGLGIGSVDGVEAIGNTIYNIPGGRFFSFDVARNVTVLNNIAANPAGVKSDVLGLNGNVGDSVDNFNLYYNYGVLQATGSSDITGQAPKFVDASRGDFELDMNSPAIDSGLSNGVEEEIEGELMLVNVPSDMGASGKVLKLAKSVYNNRDSGRGKCLDRPAMDFNKDCRVDSGDFAIFAQGWLDCNLEPSSACWE